MCDCRTIIVSAPESKYEKFIGITLLSFLIFRLSASALVKKNKSTRTIATFLFGSLLNESGVGVLIFHKMNSIVVKRMSNLNSGFDPASQKDGRNEPS